MKTVRQILATQFGLFFLLASCGMVTAQSFYSLGVFPGATNPNSFANAISADGTTVVGYGNSTSGIEAFRWTPSAGFQGLGDLAGGFFTSHARAVSADGSVIVGTGYDGDGPEYDSDVPNRAFVWTVAGIAPLAEVTAGAASEANGVSADGQRIVGQSVSTAVVWESGSFITLADFAPNGISSSDARAITADGSYVIGSSYDGQNRAVRWNVETPTAPPIVIAASRSAAFAVSADGSTAVGESGSGSNSRAAAWATGLGPPVPDAISGVGVTANTSRALAVNADGTVAVGEAFISILDPFDPEFTDGAFIWDKANGLRNLKFVLESDHGLDLSGWKLNSATGISADGLTIVGNGSFEGVDQAWIATVPQTIDPTLGDVNGDGTVNFQDIAPFIALLSDGGYQDQADVNEDGLVNFFDISAFIALLSGQ